MSQEITQYDWLKAELSAAEQLSDVLEIKNKAEALRQFMRRNKESLEKQNWFAEISVRAAYKAGSMLQTMVNHEGGRPPGKPSHDGRVFDTLAELGLNYNASSRWQRLAQLNDAELEAFIAELKAKNEEITLKACYMYAVQQGVHEQTEILKRQGVVLPSGEYSCIVIDPPWETGFMIRNVRPNQGGLEYPTMTDDELLEFPLPAMAADDCHLYLWATHKKLPVALALAEHWGFEYKCLLTWVKNVGFTPFTWMYSTEHALFCTKGSLPFLAVGKRLDFTGKVREHSRKPDEFYELVKEVSPGPRIDVFSREVRDGFEQYGNEPEKYAEQ